MPARAAFWASGRLRNSHCSAGLMARSRRGMIPGRGVERRAREVLQPGQVRDHRVGQRPGRADQEPGRQRGAARGRAAAELQPPPAAVRVPAGGGDLVAEPDVPGHPLRGRDLVQVGPDLRLRGEATGPAGIRREREAVQVRGHVTGRAGVGVVPPGAAQRVVPLQHHQVVQTGPLEPGRRPDPAEAGPDDGHAEVGHHEAGPIRPALRQMRRASGEDIRPAAVNVSTACRANQVLDSRQCGFAAATFRACLGSRPTLA